MNFLPGSLSTLHQFWVQVHSQEAKATRVARLVRLIQASCKVLREMGIRVW